MRRVGTVGVTAALLGVLVTSAFVILPLVGRPPVIRAGPILMAAAILLLLTSRPWKWSDAEWARAADWHPSNRVVWVTATTCGLILFWFVLTRFNRTYNCSPK